MKMIQCPACGEMFDEDKYHTCPFCNTTLDKYLDENVETTHNWFQYSELRKYKNLRIGDYMPNSFEELHDIYDVPYVFAQYKAHDEMVGLYKDIFSTRILTENEELFLTKKYFSGSETEKATAKKLLWETMKWLSVYFWLKSDTNIPFTLFVRGTEEGFNKAIENFDPSKGFTFYLYVEWWIIQTIRRNIVKQARCYNIPGHTIDSYNRIQDKTYEFYEKNDRKPTKSELSKLVFGDETMVDAIDRINSRISESGYDKTDIYFLDYVETNEFDGPANLGNSLVYYNFLCTREFFQAYFKHKYDGGPDDCLFEYFVYEPNKMFYLPSELLVEIDETSKSDKTIKTSELSNLTEKYDIDDDCVNLLINYLKIRQITLISDTDPVPELDDLD